MKREKVGGIIGCCVLVACLGTIGCDKIKQFKPKKAEVAAERIKVDVKVEKVVRTTLYRERRFLGTLEALRETDIAPQTPGRVRSLPVKIGNFVAQGQVVARMDDVQLVATEAQYQQVKANYERMKSLYESDAIPKSQFESVEAAYTAMKRQMEGLQENTVLVAPFAGVVTSTAVEEGELYSGSMMPGASGGLVHIAQLDPLKIDLQVDDQTVRFVKKGQTVRLSIDQVDDSVPLRGKVDFVNPQADPASRSFGVRVVVPNKDRLLRPGYFAEVRLILGEKSGVLALPRSAVVDERVFVVEGSMACAHKVTLGWLTDEYAEVLEGVAENDLVVVAGNKALPDSARVNVVE
ncbi:MAG: efflux RND transporter periplasmic adaptor subunit [Chitinispirillaceae bacterium]|nr:efflux RND transporter periplasmic adaptor subunit [Chitinispirillaceae bacterium]